MRHIYQMSNVIYTVHPTASTIKHKSQYNSINGVQLRMRCSLTERSTYTVQDSLHNNAETAEQF